ncbi:hypothetical protein T4E_920 [Trichinella pseudospiralis]|uniref:Uncharacterized protein n=1 Tax=Trichinella pseudospiralis TaxID=6337 RepID=A0A0V0Y019_TRIPS|nr:hypothetical protein T4E_920 [Trichinella pseudospiralis]
MHDEVAFLILRHFDYFSTRQLCAVLQECMSSLSTEQLRKSHCSTSVNSCFVSKLAKVLLSGVLLTNSCSAFIKLLSGVCLGNSDKIRIERYEQTATSNASTFQAEWLKTVNDIRLGFRLDCTERAPLTSTIANPVFVIVVPLGRYISVNIHSLLVLQAIARFITPT